MFACTHGETRVYDALRDGGYKRRIRKSSRLYVFLILCIRKGRPPKGPAVVPDLSAPPYSIYAS